MKTYKLYKNNYILNGVIIKTEVVPRGFIYKSGVDHGEYGEDCLHHWFDPITEEQINLYRSEYGLEPEITEKTVQLAEATVRWHDKLSGDGTLRLQDGTPVWFYITDAELPNNLKVLVYGVDQGRCSVLGDYKGQSKENAW